MDTLLQINQEATDALESQTLQLSLAPESPTPLFSVPPPLAHALMLQTSKRYTIGMILTAFHTYILNHSLGRPNGVLALDTHIAHILNCPQKLPYSAAVVNLCRYLLHN